ncbi:hypothetical protein J6590_061142 [Homalodisca vitripennis]|nr:hypothetical protein J6590_061142 [Homalodisca vitripennis]
MLRAASPWDGLGSVTTPEEIHTSMLSNMDSDSVSIFQEEESDEDISPLFLQLVCTIQSKGQMGNCTVRILPTCMGHMAMETFCMGLNMPCMSHSTYDKQVAKVTNQTILYTQVTKKGQNRVTTGLVIDFEVLSKYCRVCERKKTEITEESDEFEDWYITHKPLCQANYSGSSPAMETEAAARMWKRSEDIGFR